MPRKKKSKVVVNSIKELKIQYKPILLKAQRKFRYELNKKSQSFQFKEVLSTGGQFSFRGVKTTAQFYRELTRINAYLNIQMTEPELFLKKAAERGEDYLALFQKGISMSDRIELGLQSDVEDLFSAYRALQEGDAGAILRGGYESETVLSYLYSYHVQGYDREALIAKGSELRDELRSRRREMFRTSTPIARFNRGGV